MTDVLALTGGRRLPSARFRVRQYVEPLAGLGITVRERPSPISAAAELPFRSERVGPRHVFPIYAAFQAAKVVARSPGVLASRRAAVTWLQKPLVHGYQTLEPLLGKPLVFDLDDAMWLAGPRGRQGTAAIAERAATVTAGNTYLGTWLGDHNPAVHIVPTAVDTRRFRPGAAPPVAPFTVGWIGTRGNLPYLYEIEDSLSSFMRRVPEAQLIVVSDEAPRLSELPRQRLRYVPWSADLEAEILRSFSVGLMPLPDTPWTRGKCSFKLLQYMATGVPFVASPVGMNADLLASGPAGLPATCQDEWVDALHFLYREPDQRAVMGTIGRRLAQEKYDTEVVANQLAGILRSVE
jgi:glycosyltransferase involved in cell wall biosynthesis